MLKASALLLSGLALFKLFSGDGWKEVTETACTRELTNNDVRQIVGLMEKCEPISPVREELLKHPFVQFWIRLSNMGSSVARKNMDTLRNDRDFVNQVRRLVQNLEENQASYLCI